MYQGIEVWGRYVLVLILPGADRATGKRRLNKKTRRRREKKYAWVWVWVRVRVWPDSLSLPKSIRCGITLDSRTGKKSLTNYKSIFLYLVSRMNPKNVFLVHKNWGRRRDRMERREIDETRAT